VSADLAGKPPRLSTVEMTEIVLPNDANPLGNMLGGRVLHLIDVAAAIAASRHCSRPCVTASIDSVHFLHPIKVGHAVLLKGQVNWAGRTSIEVGVEVYAEDFWSTGRRTHTCSALLTFVAVDPETGKPTVVPPVLPETEEEKERHRGAEERRAERLRRRGGV
jgi:acyl-CoA hydrolase